MYVPRPIPNISNIEELRRFVDEELHQIALHASEPDELRFVPAKYEPKKKVAGMLVYANGTGWNPGSGAGFYQYNGTAWVKLF